MVHGWLSDGCTRLHGFDQKTEGKVISMRVLTTRPRDAICTQAIKRFQETYPVNTEGLAPGTYTLDVNGKSKKYHAYPDLPAVLSRRGGQPFSSLSARPGHRIRRDGATGPAGRHCRPTRPAMTRSSR